MATISIPIERFIFGNEHWRSYRAVGEMTVYCDLLENLQDRIDSLEIRGKDEEVTFTNVQAVISSYAIEIAMKSLWALDNATEPVPHEHNLVVIFEGLKEETVKSLAELQLTRQTLDIFPTPFVSNRYSMECRNRDITVYDVGHLRSLIQLLGDKLTVAREGLLNPREASSDSGDGPSTPAGD